MDHNISKECLGKNHERCQGLVELSTVLANCSCPCFHPLLNLPFNFVSKLLDCKGEFGIVEGAIRDDDLLCPIMHLAKKFKLNTKLFVFETRAPYLNNMVHIVEKAMRLTPAQSSALIRASDQQGGVTEPALRKALSRSLVIPTRKKK